MAHQYEVEIKSLLGEKDKADELVQKIQEKYSDIAQQEDEKQLNHYFNTDGDFSALKDAVAGQLSDDARERYDKIVAEGKSISLRTRETNGSVLLVMKASIDDTTSENGISRIEFEAKLPMSIDELDQKILDAGFTYQAKWSRERQTYANDKVTLCIDKNAGYGYLAEFEKVTDDADAVESVRDDLRALMNELDVVELAQDRLERMFSFYNENWEDYYGTDKTFTIE
jgi:adenylate cyclase class IV